MSNRMAVPKAVCEALEEKLKSVEAQIIQATRALRHAEEARADILSALGWQ